MRNVFFSEVIDQLNAIEDSAQAMALLDRIRSSYGLKNVVYFAAQIPELTVREPYLAVTYDDAWVQHYKDRDYVSVDPVLSAGLQRMLPTDWSTFDRTSGPLKTFFGEAEEFGVGRQGLTMPIRGVNGEAAMLSITSEESDREWIRLRTHYMRDFQLIANVVHEMILRVERVQTVIPRLTRREIECLKWASEGKTYEEIAIILGIRRGTVQSYMEFSRLKLNAVNTTHSVTRALRLKII
ncbi:LuxR family transcriptional regulator [Stappia sp. ES.058]|uniref:helix-turn-helix transcriptional regulator n=1 Tax=Stappia sp. ES.058 TaxID=1881061 RepID=UPI00087B9E17|nr:LuxR family transcriptional regulator [Stappia sp. ES.058]SDT97483.1 transcriptional regulator, LuxR family [Stappia sp. ES.058]